MSDIARVASSLDDLNRWSVLKGAAALALWPANADRMRSLAALSHVLIEGVANHAAGGRPPATADRWRRLLTSDEGRPWRETFAGDYYKAPPAVDGTLLSVRFMLLSGLLEAPALHLTLWSEAIRAALVQHSDMNLEAASRLVLAATCLSDMVLRDAELEHTRWPSHPLQGAIGVPDDGTYERLLSAVEQPLLDPSESVLCLPALLPLIAGNGNPPTASWLSPLVIRDDRVLVASPADLLRATLARAAQAVMRSPARSIAIEQLSRASAGTLRTAASDMRWRLEESDAGSFLFRFDVDKLAAVELIVAPVQSDDREHVDVGSAFDAAARRLEERRRRDPEIEVGLVLFIGDGRPPRTTPPPPDQPFGPWLLTLGDFQLLGDALRLDPTALWRLLRAVALPAEATRAEILDGLGQLHREEAPIHREVEQLVSEVGHEYLHQHARLMSTRHVAPHPYEPRWVEVTRWPGSPSAKVFAAEAAVDAYALLARHGGRFCWVMADDEVESREDLLAMLVEMTTFWAVRMLEVGWLLLPEGTPGPLDRDELEATMHVAFDDRPGPALVVRKTGIRRVGIVFGQAFLELLALPDNQADRMLVEALLQWWFRVDSKRLQPLVDRAAPAGRGTFVVLGDPAARRRPPVVEPLDPLPGSVWREVDLAAAARVVDKGKALAASGDEAKILVDRVVHALVALCDDALDECGTDLLPVLLGLHERMTTLEELHAVTVPIRAELPDSESVGGPSPDAGVAIALRGLIERVTALPPTGSGRASVSRLAHLRVLAEFVIDWGVVSDALMSGTVTVTVDIDDDGCRFDLEGPLPHARQWVERRRVATEPERMLDAHAEWWAPGDTNARPLDEPLPIETDRDWLEIDQAMEESWGFRWEELLRTLTALALHARDESGAVAFATLEDATEVAHAATCISRDRVAAIITELTLGRCPDYHQLKRGHKPWDSNRERSYIRRPFALLADGRVGWTWSHTKRVPHYYATQVVWERLRCEGPLRKAINRLNRRLDRAFEDDLASVCADLEWDVEVRVNRLAGVRLERARGQDIGNLDVIAFDRRLGELWLLDAKRLAPAFTPNDMAREHDALKGSIDKHLERVAWIKERLDLLVDDRRIGPPDHGGDWRVEAALITDTPLVGANMGWQGLAVWSVDELQYRLPRERS